MKQHKNTKHLRDTKGKLKHIGKQSPMGKQVAGNSNHGKTIFCAFDLTRKGYNSKTNLNQVL